MSKKVKQSKHVDPVLALVNEILDLFEEEDIDRGPVGREIENLVRKALQNGLRN